MSTISTLGSALKNWQPTTSVLAGGAASVITYTIGAILVALGISIPGIGPITMVMVATASPVVGHIVTYLVPDSQKDALNQLATKLQVSVEHLKEFVPEIQETYPTGKNGQTVAASVSQGSPNGNYNQG